MRQDNGPLEPFDECLRARLKVELLKLESLRASLSLSPELQGPPAAGHGGGAAALLLEMIRMVVGERGDEAVLPRPIRIEVAFHHTLPLEIPLRAEVDRRDGVWQGRILHDDKPLIEAVVRPVPPLAPVGSDLRNRLGTAASSLPVPRYEWCLACGRSNPRGAQLRFAYTEEVVWQSLTPPPGFRSRDGSVALGYFCVVGDELGWWLGALRQGECGLSSRLVVTLGHPVRFGTSLLAVGDRSTVRSVNPKGRLWDTEAMIVTGDWKPVAKAEVRFAGSRAFSKTMLPGFIREDEAAAVQQAFPRYADHLEEEPES